MAGGRRHLARPQPSALCPLIIPRWAEGRRWEEEREERCSRRRRRCAPEPVSLITLRAASVSGKVVRSASQTRPGTGEEAQQPGRQEEEAEGGSTKGGQFRKLQIGALSGPHSNNPKLQAENSSPGLSRSEAVNWVLSGTLLMLRQPEPKIKILVLPAQATKH